MQVGVGGERDREPTPFRAGADRTQVPAGVHRQGSPVTQVDQVGGVAQPLVDDRLDLVTHAQPHPFDRRSTAGRPQAHSGEAVLEPRGADAFGVEQPDGVVGVDAVGPAAVGHDVRAVGDLAQPGLQVVDRDGDRAADVAGGVLGLRADVEHNHVAVTQPVTELVPGDGVEVLRSPR